MTLGAVWAIQGSICAEEDPNKPAAPPATEPVKEAPPREAAQSPQTTPPVSTIAGSADYVEAFLDYRLGIQLKIESAWANYVQSYRGSLQRGRAVFTYHVNPDGKITLVEPKPGTANPSFVALAHRTIVEANKELVPFPEKIRSYHSSGYFNQVAFTLK